MQPGWQDLFSPSPVAGTVVRWRVLRKRGEPMLVVPASGRAAAASLALYPAQTAKARRVRNLLRAAFKLNLPLPLERAEARIDFAASFARFLTEQGRAGQFPRMGIFAGNPRTAGRRFILLLFGANDEPVRVVKAGIGQAAMRLIQREQDFLASVPDSVAGVPELFGTFRDENLGAFAMEFLDGEFPAAADTGVVAGLMNSWVLEKNSVTIGETSPWRELASAGAASPLWPRLEKLGARAVRPVIWHGDFAPWNMKPDHRTGRCVVFDWERGELAGVPGWDWFHFVIQSGVLVKKLSVAALRAELETLLDSENFKSYANRCGMAGGERELALAYLLYNLEVIKPSEGGGPMRALLELLTDSWTSGSKS